MEEIKRYEFKSSTVDDAVAKGLKELGLTREEVDCEIKSYGGIFRAIQHEDFLKQ